MVYLPQEDLDAIEAGKQAAQPAKAVFLREINEGNDQPVRRDTTGDLLLTKYGIPADQWKMWATAAGIPNAKWDDPTAATQVATWAYNFLWTQFGGNLGLMAIGWRYGAATAHQLKRLYGGTPANSILQQILGMGGASLVQAIVTATANILTPDQPQGQAGQFYPTGSQGDPAEVSLTFTPEEGELYNPEEDQGSGKANPVHTALAGILSRMADKNSVGGARSRIEDVEVQQVPEGQAPPGESPPEPVQSTTPTETTETTEST